MQKSVFDIKMEEVLTEIDHKRIDELRNITNYYFRPLPENHNGKFLKEGFKRTIFVFVIMLISVTAHFFVGRDLIAILLIAPLFLYMFILAHYVKKSKKEYIKKDKFTKLNEEFFIQKLKEHGLEIQIKEMDYYRVFLKRFINYFLLKETDELASTPSAYFEKNYTEELTAKELLISAILFRTYNEFIHRSRNTSRSH